RHVDNTRAAAHLVTYQLLHNAQCQRVAFLAFRDMVDAKDEVIAYEVACAGHQFPASCLSHTQCRRDLPLYLLRRRGGERVYGQLCAILPRREQPGDLQEVGTEIMSPGRDAMGLVNHELEQRQMRQIGTEARIAQAFW